ncbi:hypothetical protein BKA57DRAFT_473844 [Linnemannia elongata]|nr:hypothetical protein BKA57DRAFT_473844 [Linnemannia elongata]
MVLCKIMIKEDVANLFILLFFCSSPLLTLTFCPVYVYHEFQSRFSSFLSFMIDCENNCAPRFHWLRREWQ